MFEAEHAELFDDDLAQDLTVNGQPIRVIPGTYTTGRSDFDGEIRTTWDFTAAAADLPNPLVPGMQLQLFNLKWDVDQVGKPTAALVEVSVSIKAT